MSSASVLQDFCVQCGVSIHCFHRQFTKMNSTCFFIQPDTELLRVKMFIKHAQIKISPNLIFTEHCSGSTSYITSCSVCEKHNDYYRFSLIMLKKHLFLMKTMMFAFFTFH